MYGPTYFPAAIEHEPIFRAILKDLKDHHGARHTVCPVPQDLDVDASLDTILRKYSKGDRFGRFTIRDFEVKGRTAALKVTNSDMGATLQYVVRGNKIRYVGPVEQFIG